MSYSQRKQNRKKKKRSRQKQHGGVFSFFKSKSNSCNTNNKIKEVIKDALNLVINQQYKDKIEHHKKLIGLVEQIIKLDSSIKCISELKVKTETDIKNLDIWKNKNKLDSRQEKSIVSIAYKQRKKYTNENKIGVYCDQSVSSLAREVANQHRNLNKIANNKKY